MNAIVNKTKEKETQQLTDVTRGMYYAASTTMSLVGQQYILFLDQFFDKDDEGVLEAKTAKVALDDKHEISVPLIALVAPKGLSLEEMTVDVSVRVDQTELSAATKGDNAPITRTRFGVTMSPFHRHDGERRRTDTVDVKMVFKASDPPEGMMRLIDEFANRIQALPSAGGPDKEPQAGQAAGTNNRAQG